ncbi:hypothetical protein [Ramlibacter sp.]|jgi:hypothetical protein|uniref:hypothetical protein n=1 Tax=Ramlibacter sp. TaxID=1917967 RepID=UPI00260843B3|nr:hypothetical protein [Ramlibacter sp.]
MLFAGWRFLLAGLVLLEVASAAGRRAGSHQRRDELDHERHPAPSSAWVRRTSSTGMNGSTSARRLAAWSGFAGVLVGNVSPSWGGLIHLAA